MLTSKVFLGGSMSLNIRRLCMNCQTCFSTRATVRAKIMVLPVRRLRSRSSHDLKFLSDVEEYVEKNFTLSDLEEQFETQNLPELVTTSKLLSNCETQLDVLREVKTALNRGKLWKDELLLYFYSLNKKKRIELTAARKMSYDYSISEKLASDEIVISNPQMLLDNEYFQYLLKETLTHAPSYTSRDLARLFYYFTALEIPPTSNVMSFLVAILQDRVNDLFPQDVLICFNAIRLLIGHRSHMIDAFKKSLFLHLNNQTVDEVSFRRILKATPLAERFRLLKYTKREPRKLNMLIVQSCVHTVKDRQPPGLDGIRELIHLLKASISQGYCHKYLFYTAAKYVKENRGQLNDKEYNLLANAVEQLKIKYRRPLRGLFPKEEE